MENHDNSLSGKEVWLTLLDETQNMIWISLLLSKYSEKWNQWYVFKQSDFRNLRNKNDCWWNAFKSYIT